MNALPPPLWQSRACRRLVLLVGLLAIPYHKGDTQQRRPANRARPASVSCAAARWSIPRQLVSPDGRAAYVETPRMVQMRDGIAMFGSPAIIWGSKESVAPPGIHTDPARALRDFLRAGLLLRRDTTVEPINRPPGVYDMDKPWAVPDGRGGAHVVWAGTADTASAASRSGGATLRYAHFDGARWTAPEEILRARTVHWGPGRATAPVVRGDTVHLAVAVFDANGGALVYARRAGDQWRTSRIGRDGFPMYATLAIDEQGAPILAFAAPDFTPGKRRDGEHLYVTRSNDGGSAWTKPTLVRASGLGAATQPRLIAPSGRPLYLLWAQRREGAPLPDSVLAVTSLDGGLSWRAAPALAVPSGLRSLEALIDDLGRLHVAGTRASSRPEVLTADGDVIHATLHRDAWTADTSRIGFAASRPSLNLVSPDSLLLVWGVARPTKVEGMSAPAEAPVGMLALLSPLCPGGRTRK